MTDEFTDAVAAAPNPDRPRDVAAVIDELTSVVERAKSMPLSASAIVSRDELLELLHLASELLPGELSQARRILQDRDAVVAQAQREASDLIDDARAQAAQLVQRTEVVRQARRQAERMVQEADAESRRLRHEADDYVDRKLAAFEIVLDRTLRTVQSGRERLGAFGQPEAEPEVGAVPGAVEAAAGFVPFDQDVS